jgi:hypothetical protein
LLLAAARTPHSRGSLSRDLSLRSSVVKTIFENGPAIEFAQTVKQWSTTEEGSKKSTQDAITLKVGAAEKEMRLH